MSKDTITISRKKFSELVRDSELLQCLQNAGVDNWEGYDEATKEFNKIEELVEEVDKLLEKDMQENPEYFANLPEMNDEYRKT